MLVDGKFEAEALLVDGGGGELSGFETSSEPGGRRSEFRAGGRSAKLLDWLYLMCDAGLLAISERDAADELLARRHARGTCLLAIRERHPAGIESEFLCKQHEPFARIAARLIEAGARGSYECDVVAHVAKRPVVCEPAVECLGVVEAELDGKAEPLVQSVGLGL